MGFWAAIWNWQRQVNDPALRRYRLITYDLRGHGLSGKPAGAEFYSQGQRWGDELHSVIAAKKLVRPTLVGWSLGGAVMTNYLQSYGDSHIAGLVFVNAVIELRPELLQPNGRANPGHRIERFENASRRHAPVRSQMLLYPTERSRLRSALRQCRSGFARDGERGS